MGFKGILIMDKAGSPVYSKFTEPNFKMDPAMMAGFMSAIQMFTSELATGTIKEFTMQNTKILYRQMEGITFIGLVDNDSKTKNIELVIEYLILMFLAKFKNQLAVQGGLHELTVFETFDEFFLRYRDAKEKDLHRCVETVSSSLLQCLLNNLVNLFPVSELVSASDFLKIIGKKLVWVDNNIPAEEERRVMNMLQAKTDMIYGKGMFDSITQEIKKKAPNLDN